MIKRIVLSGALAAMGLGMLGCSEGGGGYYGYAGTDYYEVPGYYAQPQYLYSGGFYVGEPFEDYWGHHRDWDRDHAYREWQHRREGNREREHERHERR